MANCPECGLNLGLVGARHVCRPREAAGCVTNSPESPVTNMGVTNNATEAVTNNNAARVRRWRTEHPDRYREYQRAYMEKRRANADNVRTRRP